MATIYPYNGSSDGDQYTPEERQDFEIRASNDYGDAQRNRDKAAEAFRKAWLAWVTSDPELSDERMCESEYAEDLRTACNLLS